MIVVAVGTVLAVVVAECWSVRAAVGTTCRHSAATKLAAAEHWIPSLSSLSLAVEPLMSSEPG